METMTIQRYDVELRALQHPQEAKIRKFIERGCIRKVNNDTYICMPIIGYNKTTYTMRRKMDGTFNCNCQHYSLYKTPCSHLAARGIVAPEIGKQGVLF